MGCSEAEAIVAPSARDGAPDEDALAPAPPPSQPLAARAEMNAGTSTLPIDLTGREVAERRAEGKRLTKLARDPK